ncbi:MAG TPA: hypothetical protein VEX12_12730 [Microbacterium sp.]|nr:hypothetical protein [Microbacterium sp.]
MGALARTGGRNSWIAWPAGLLCAAVVAVLAWLAQPMLPVSVAWMGDMLRATTSQPVAAPATEAPASRAIASGELDCRALYPDDLWAEITWTPEVLLSQDAAPPPTVITALTDALAPSVRISCHWQAGDGRTIESTLSRVAGDAGAIAESSLRGQGFDCASDSDAVVCTRTAADVLEEHTLRGGLWLSSVERGWHPEFYGTRLAAHVWG